MTPRRALAFLLLLGAAAWVLPACGRKAKPEPLWTALPAAFHIITSR